MVIDLLSDKTAKIDSNEVIKLSHHSQWVLRQVLISDQSVDSRGQERPQSDVLLHCLAVLSNIAGLTLKAFGQLQPGSHLKSRISNQMNYLVEKYEIMGL